MAYRKRQFAKFFGFSVRFGCMVAFVVALVAVMIFVGPHAARADSSDAASAAASLSLSESAHGLPLEGDDLLSPAGPPVSGGQSAAKLLGLEEEGPMAFLPEPGTVTMLSLAALLVFLWRRKW